MAAPGCSVDTDADAPSRQSPPPPIIALMPIHHHPSSCRISSAFCHPSSLHRWVCDHSQAPPITRTPSIYGKHHFKGVLRSVRRLRTAMPDIIMTSRGGPHEVPWCPMVFRGHPRDTPWAPAGTYVGARGKPGCPARKVTASHGCPQQIPREPMGIPWQTTWEAT